MLIGLLLNVCEFNPDIMHGLFEHEEFESDPDSISFDFVFNLFFGGGLMFSLKIPFIVSGVY